MLGLVVALPVILAVAFLMVLAFTGNEAGLWLIIPPLAVLGALLIAVAARALRAGRATVLSLAILGVIELALGIFVLAATRPLTGGALTGGIVAFIAAAVSFAAAVTLHLEAARGTSAIGSGNSG